MSEGGSKPPVVRLVDKTREQAKARALGIRKLLENPEHARNAIIVTRMEGMWLASIPDGMGVIEAVGVLESAKLSLWFSEVVGDGE